MKLLLNNLLGNKFIQIAPHSHDITYPIETLSAELKKELKSKNIKNLDELRQISIEEGIE